MPIAIAVSLFGHAILILVMAVGLPDWLEPERHTITADSVGVVTEAQLAALSKPQLPPGRDAAEAKPDTAAERAAADAAQADAANADQADAANAAQADAANAAQADAASADQADAANAENQPPSAAPAVSADAARNIADAPAAEALSAPNQLAAAPPPATAPLPVPPARTPDASDAPPPPIPDATSADAPPPPEAPATEAPAVETATAPQPPAPQPDTPETPPPRAVIAQTPPAPRQPQARGAVVPPRRPPNLDPPDEQLASLPPETARDPAPRPAPKKDFLSSMQSAIGSKPSDDNLASVAESLGVGVPGSRLSSAHQKAISSRLGGCWRPIAGARDAKSLAVTLAVEFSRTSEVLNIQVVERPSASAGRFGQVAIDRAKQAVQLCSPLNKFGQLTLPQDKYSDWSRMRIRFDPSELAG